MSSFYLEKRTKFQERSNSDLIFIRYWWIIKFYKYIIWNFQNWSYAGITPFTGFWPQLFADENFGTFVIFTSVSQDENFESQNLELRIIGENGLDLELSAENAILDLLCIETLDDKLIIFYQEKISSPIS